MHLCSDALSILCLVMPPPLLCSIINNLFNQLRVAVELAATDAEKCQFGRTKIKCPGALSAVPGFCDFAQPLTRCIILGSFRQGQFKTGLLNFNLRRFTLHSFCLKLSPWYQAFDTYRFLGYLQCRIKKKMSRTQIV